MPYRPTGKPPGRPRKHPVAEVEQEPIAVPAPAKPSRARQRFRMVAEMLNPSPYVQIFGGRGRPRHKPRHSSVKA